MSQNWNWNFLRSFSGQAVLMMKQGQSLASQVYHLEEDLQCDKQRLEFLNRKKYVYLATRILTDTKYLNQTCQGKHWLILQFLSLPWEIYEVMQSSTDAATGQWQFHWTARNGRILESDWWCQACISQWGFPRGARTETRFAKYDHYSFLQKLKHHLLHLEHKMQNLYLKLKKKLNHNNCQNQTEKW